MNSIKFECPHCHSINSGDESSYGQRVKEPTRTQYRAARLREGVRPTEFMESN
jgi:hypothetical protein